jgi:hypothetical protein
VEKRFPRILERKYFSKDEDPTYVDSNDFSPQSILVAIVSVSVSLLASDHVIGAIEKSMVGQLLINFFIH